MVEGRNKQEALQGIHPVLPSLALAFKRLVATIERESACSRGIRADRRAPSL